MRELHSHKDLGFHSGLISDVTLELVECGALTGARKSIDPGIIVTGAVFGSERLHEFSADPSVRMHGVSYTHEVPVIATIDNYVSINGGMMVDLYGQVVADNLTGMKMRRRLFRLYTLIFARNSSAPGIADLTDTESGSRPSLRLPGG